MIMLQWMNELMTYVFITVTSVRVCVEAAKDVERVLAPFVFLIWREIRWLGVLLELGRVE